MRSPFKFLDAFTLADREVFFGRDQEIEELYDLVFKARLLLIYGNSGTGKTSLIQCGLASKFDGPDWYPCWIRKNGDINQALRQILSKALKVQQFDGTLREAIEKLFNYYLRPVYLIFDQFEELFILGTPREQQQFVEDIQQLRRNYLARLSSSFGKNTWVISTNLKNIFPSFSIIAYA